MCVTLIHDAEVHPCSRVKPRFKQGLLCEAFKQMRVLIRLCPFGCREVREEGLGERGSGEHLAPCILLNILDLDNIALMTFSEQKAKHIRGTPHHYSFCYAISAVTVTDT